MAKRGWAAGAASILAGAILDGCSSGHPGKPGPASSAARPAPPTRFDPPVKFDAGRSWSLPSRSVTLADATVYAAAQSLTAISVATGRPAWSLSPRTPAMRGGGPGRPLTGALGGRPVVLAAFPVTIPGHGTTPEEPAVELIAADTGTGHAIIDDVHAFPGLGSDAVLWDAISPTVVGADDHTVTIRVENDSDSATLVVDPSAHTIRWFRRFSSADVVAGGLVITESYGATTALSIPDQATRWKAAGSRDTLLGPGLVGLAKQTHFPDSQTVRVLDATTGKPAPGWPDPIQNAYTCAYDEQSVTLCHTQLSDEVSAFDTATGRRLWSLPSGGRIAPNVTAVWHGAVYGYTRDNGPVILDARTGQDRQTDPGVKVLDVGPYGAVSEDEQGHPYFYPGAG